MKNNNLSILGRVMIIISSALLLTVLFFPMWQIQLAAPQYPEGLVLLIFPGKLGGNVDIINGLNHYIGMKTLHSKDFFEFTILPYIIVFFSASFLLIGIIGKRKLLNIIFILFVCFGVIAMIDFWKWEYNYGHNLNPDAAIIVPGMAYQPPLIGFKQLLNFGAYSIPDIGGWLFVAVGCILLFLVLIEWRAVKKKNRLAKSMGGLATIALLFFFSSCNTAPRPIIVGRDNCDFCKMKVSDNRFGAEIITKKGKVYKFDDAHCIISFLQRDNFDRKTVGEIYLTDFDGDHSLLKATKAMLLHSEGLRTPMGGNIAAFNNMDSLKNAMKQYEGSILLWSDLYKE
ncbi:MAG: nitrous oxide reductase accessory protein NosL [Bacteroidetes bacterium]|nr:nitrous oxide reductase accessory protein NosL [Bacteroidota bacterium]